MITVEDRDTLSKLKFIGQVQSGFKLNVKNLTIQPDTWYTSILRTFLTPDDRDKSFQFISVVINKSFDILIQFIGKITKDSDNVFYNIICSNVLDDLSTAIVGINHIRETYKNDKLLCCQYEVLTSEVAARISEIKKNCSSFQFIQKPSGNVDYLNL